MCPEPSSWEPTYTPHPRPFTLSFGKCKTSTMTRFWMSCHRPSLLFSPVLFSKHTVYPLIRGGWWQPRPRSPWASQRPACAQQWTGPTQDLCFYLLSLSVCELVCTEWKTLLSVIFTKWDSAFYTTELFRLHWWTWWCSFTWHTRSHLGMHLDCMCIWVYTSFHFEEMRSVLKFYFMMLLKTKMYCVHFWWWNFSPQLPLSLLLQKLKF